MIKCISFDMDDTLYYERDYYKSGMAAVADVISADHNLAAGSIFQTLWDIFTAGNYDRTFNAGLDELGLGYEKVYIEKLINSLRSHDPDIKLPADSRAVLDKLSKKYTLALVTDGYLSAQQNKVKALGLDSYFDPIIYTDQLGAEYWKPSTKAFELLLKKLNLTGKECVYIGDNLHKDFTGPNKLGFTTIHIDTPHRFHLNPSPDEESKPDYSLNTISQLPELLEKIDV